MPSYGAVLNSIFDTRNWVFLINFDYVLSAVKGL